MDGEERWTSELHELQSATSPPESRFFDAAIACAIVALDFLSDAVVAA